MLSKVSGGIAVLAAALLVALPAEAARFHVHAGGTRSSGPSTPGDCTRRTRKVRMSLSSHHMSSSYYSMSRKAYRFISWV